MLNWLYILIACASSNALKLLPVVLPCLKISNQIDRYLNLNNIGNLCYLSKSNNQRKSNRLPSAYLEYLETQNETKLHTEFLSQTFWNELISESFNGEINNKAAFDSYLHIRGQRLIESLVTRVGGGNSE